jgi:hypothetical protein
LCSLTLTLLEGGAHLVGVFMGNWCTILVSYFGQ